MTPRAIARLPLTVLVLLAPSLLPSPASAAVEAWQVPRANARIAFAVAMSNGQEDIYVMEADGTSRQPLITSRALSERQPAWSATSEELLYSTTGSIWRAGADGSERTKLTDLVGDEERPRWSPDGSKILFTHSAADAEEVHVVPAAGGPVTNITAHPARDVQADWSPDGTRIVFTTNRLGNLDLFVMGADGTDPVPLVSGAGLQRHGSWSPDGSRIVYDSTNGRGETEIFVANADGGGVTQLTFDPAHDREPVWSPDGSKILFTSDRAGSHDVYVMAADGSDLVRLTSDPAEERRPDWGSVRSVGILDSSVEEGDGTTALRFDIGLSVIHDTPVTVAWATSDGSAVAGEDYDAASGTATIPAGASSAEVSVPVLADDLDEISEYLALTLTNPSGAAMSRASAMGTILDDDPSPLLSITDPAVVETPGGSSATFDLTLSTVSGRDVTVAYTTEAGSAGGADYQISEGTTTVPAGALSTAMSISVLDDALDELEESFDLVLSEPQGADLPDPRGTATITDDDDPPTLSLGDTAVAEGDGEPAAAAVPIELSAPSGREVAVTYATSDEGAKAPLDYEAAAGTAVVAPGNFEGVIQVPVVGDDVDEPDESFNVAVSSAEGATVADGLAMTTIVDDDPEPVVSVTDATVEEGLTTEVEVSLSHPSAREVRVDLVSVDGSAVAPDDYESVLTSVAVPAGDTRASLSVEAAEDVLDEAEETFEVEFSGSVGGTIGDGIGQVSIVDDDVPPSVSVGDAEVTEGDDGTVTLLFHMTVSAPSGQAVMVSYRTSDGSATAGTDYASAEGDVTLLPGATSASVPVVVSGETLHEGDETLTLAIVDADAAVIADGSATGRIVDDDPAPELAVADAAAGESAPAVAFTVSLSAPSAMPVSAAFASANGTAVAGQDYKRVVGTLQIAPGETSATITVPLLGDAVDEPDETFAVLLTDPTGATLADWAATGTILDDDEPLPPPTPSSISISDASAGEGQASMAFTVTLSGPSATQVSVAYATSNGTATVGGDFSRAASVLKIPAGQTWGTVTVSLLNDALDEQDEAFIVALSSPKGATLADDQATGTILDDDP